MCRTCSMTGLTLLVWLLLGCPARWKVVFINGSDECMTLQLRGAPDSSQRTFTILPSDSRSTRLERANRLAVFDSRGALLFEREAFRAQEWAEKYPHIYVLLTKTNAYAVRPEYRDTWREHIGEITKTN
jgi:hypothetical protein